MKDRKTFFWRWQLIWVKKLKIQQTEGERNVSQWKQHVQKQRGEFRKLKSVQFYKGTNLNQGEAGSKPGEAHGQILQGLGHHGLRSSHVPKNTLDTGQSQVYIL